MSDEQSEGANAARSLTPAQETALAEQRALLDRPAFFINRGMPPKDFDERMNRGSTWLPEGAALLRSAFILLRHDEDDKRARFEPLAAGAHRPERVVYPAIMLAAMAVECALKAVIAETTKAVSSGGKIVRDVSSHGLKALATSAAIEPADYDEAAALGEGHDFIVWKGRFPSPVTAKDYPGFSGLDEWPLLRAYRRLFVRAAARVAHAEYANGQDGVRDKTREDHVAASVRRVSEWLDGADDSHAPAASPRPPG